MIENQRRQDRAGSEPALEGGTPESEGNSTAPIRSLTSEESGDARLVEARGPETIRRSPVW